MPPDLPTPLLHQEMGCPATGPTAALPRAPVLDWSSFKRMPRACLPGIEQARHRFLLSSGRAALYQALRQLRLPPGSLVLVPTYHSLTMVAPVLCAGHTPHFIGLQPDGLPDLKPVGATTAAKTKALIAAHYFGLPRSFQPVREWCDRHGVALIEDCAHCLYGQAGERAAGHWGDFSTASLSKFLPVPEAGLLASASRPIADMPLAAPGFRAQVKGSIDVLEFAVAHERLGGLDRLLRPLFRLKDRVRKGHSQGSTAAAVAPSMMDVCNMGRIEEEPLAVSLLLSRLLPRGRLAAQRRENFARYAAWFAEVRGARPLFEAAPEAVAPYVFPLWVDDPEPVYRAARELRLPVFRWDRWWPGSTLPREDAGARWRRHVLQLLCHQDLRPADVDDTARALIRLVRLQGSPTISGVGTP